MEKNFEDNNDDDCDLLYLSAVSVVEIFTIKNREYFKLDAENLKNKRKISEKEKEIEIIIENIKKKYNNLALIKACKNKSHSKLAFDLDHIFEDNKRMINTFNKEKALKLEIISKYKNIELEESSEEDNCLSNKKEEIKNNELNVRREQIKNMIQIKNDYHSKNNKIKVENDIITKNSNYINNDIELEKNQIKCQINLEDNQNILGEIDLFTLEQMIENSKEYSGDEEFRKNLIQLKNQIEDLTLGLENGIIQSNEKLDLISDDIKLVDINVDDINCNLKEAAIERNKFNKIKYPVLLGGIGSGLGLIVPGFGTIIGGSIGTLLGCYLSKLEKKQIDKINVSKK